MILGVSGCGAWGDIDYNLDTTAYAVKKAVHNVTLIFCLISLPIYAIYLHCRISHFGYNIVFAFYFIQVKYLVKFFVFYIVPIH